MNNDLVVFFPSPCIILSFCRDRCTSSYHWFPIMCIRSR